MIVGTDTLYPGRVADELRAIDVAPPKELLALAALQEGLATPLPDDHVRRRVALDADVDELRIAVRELAIERATASEEVKVRAELIPTFHQLTGQILVDRSDAIVAAMRAPFRAAVDQLVSGVSIVGAGGNAAGSLGPGGSRARGDLEEGHARLTKITEQRRRLADLGGHRDTLVRGACWLRADVRMTAEQIEAFELLKWPQRAEAYPEALDIVTNSQAVETAAAARALSAKRRAAQQLAPEHERKLSAARADAQLASAQRLAERSRGH